MSQEETLPQVKPGHYVALCGTCLAVIFVAQLQMGLELSNALAVMVGAAALIYKLRAGPLLLLTLVAIAQLAAHGERRPLEVTDVCLCAAMLGYVAGHYRLQGMWHQILAADRRMRAGAPRRVFPWIYRRVPVVREKRPAGQITPWEIAVLVVSLPAWAAVAQLASALIPPAIHPALRSFLVNLELLPPGWNNLGFPEPFVKILTLLWFLAVGLGVTAALLNLWKHRRHDPATAQLYLQDQLWRDTRGEQRRVNRWLAWWRLAQSKE